MDMKQAHDEIRALAQQAAGLPVSHVASEVLFLAADTLWEAGGVRSVKAYGEEDEDEFEKQDRLGEEYIQENLTPFKKKGMSAGYWSPPHGVALNRALMGWNVWQFSLLPMFPKKTAYRPASDRLPEGLVIRPGWNSAPALRDKLFRSLTPDLAKKLVQFVKGSATVQEIVRREIEWVESNFGITVPSGIKAKLAAEAVKTADRRWSVDRLRVKNRLIPFDGSKPVDLGAWD